MNAIKIESKVHFGHGRRNKKLLRTGEKPQPVPGRVLRVAKLMALAIRFDRLVRDGVVTDYAELSRLGHVTRARMTQIMNLVHLAPDVQERILLTPAAPRSRPIPEHRLRDLTTEPRWTMQRTIISVLERGERASACGTSEVHQ